MFANAFILRLSGLRLGLASLGAPKSEWTYHNLTLQRTISSPRYFNPTVNKQPEMIQQVNRVEFCYKGNDLHVGQAVCNHYGAGDVYRFATMSCGHLFCYIIFRIEKARQNWGSHQLRFSKFPL